jgi:hypothetical protein
MKPIIKSFLTFFGFLLMDIVLLLLFFHFFITATSIQANNLISQNCEQNITEIIEQIALNLSNNNEFIFFKYDCTQFSEVLVNGLNKSNISAYCVSGLYDKIYAHTWVEVLVDNQIYPVEATQGYIISEKDYEKHYIILKKGFCF